MTTIELDQRIFAFDPDTGFSDEALREQLPAGNWQFVQPKPFVCGNKRLSLRAKPDAASAQVTEALPGELLHWLWEMNGWARVRTVHDGYLGWVNISDIQLNLRPETTDLAVTALRAHAFAGPKVSQPILAELSLGVPLKRRAADIVEENHRRWVPVELPDHSEAWVQEVCFGPLTQDKAALALRFLETPYVWGGRSAWGLDCSGLTQLVYGACGISLPRDADQQEQFLTKVETPEAGDLVFFPGHVGVMLDERRLVHANATHMRVSIEALGDGVYGQRLAASCTGFGRYL